MRSAETTQLKNRRGFTLLELLVVVGIIALMMSLLFFAMNSLTANAEEEATKVTINKISRLFEQRLEAFDRAFKGSRRDAYVKATVALLAKIDGRFDYYNQHPELAPPAIILLSKKAAMRFEFPQRMAELLLSPSDDGNGNGLPDRVEQAVARPTARATLIQKDPVGAEPTAAAVQALVNSRWAIHQANISNGDDNTESSELLYYTLTAAGTFGTSPVDGDQFSPTEVKDTDGDGLPEFVDAWGEPLRFYRWPTRMIDPTAPNPFEPDLMTPNEVTDVDSTPDDSEADGLREVTSGERLYANLMIHGLPPAPTPLRYVDGAGNISITTPRDPLLVDPDDPVGLLYSLIEDPQYKGLGINLTQEFNEGKYHTPDTYHTPLIISAGPDRQLGLFEPHEVDYDLNGNGTVDPGEEMVGECEIIHPTTHVVQTVDLNNGSFDGVLGNLAQYYQTRLTTDGDSITEVPSSIVLDQLTDNLTSRNRRAGGNR